MVSMGQNVLNECDGWVMMKKTLSMKEDRRFRLSSWYFLFMCIIWNQGKQGIGIPHIIINFIVVMG